MTAKRTLAVLTLVLASATAVRAQETRHTVTNHSANPSDDTKQNSPAVPDAYALTGHFDRIVVIRLKARTNLLGGIESVIKRQHIQNGVFLSGIGSLRGYEVHSVTNRDLPTQDTFVRNPTQPADLVSVNGYVINGRVHAHMTLATPDKVIAGHMEAGNEVYTYAIVTVGVMNDTDLDKIDDKGYR